RKALSTSSVTPVFGVTGGGSIFAPRSSRFISPMGASPVAFPKSISKRGRPLQRARGTGPQVSLREVERESAHVGRRGLGASEQRSARSARAAAGPPAELGGRPSARALKLADGVWGHRSSGARGAREQRTGPQGYLTDPRRASTDREWTRSPWRWQRWAVSAARRSRRARSARWSRRPSCP